MTIEEIKAKLKTPEYDFLRTDEHLGDQIIMLLLGGSYAYGTNIETSDIDLRGIRLNTGREILSGRYYQQFENDNTDTVIYSVNKYIDLLTACNPNVIETLGCRPEHYLYLSKVGQMLLDNRRLFISKRCINTYGGFSTKQFRRLQNALSRDSFTVAQREEYILRTIKSLKTYFGNKYKGISEETFRTYIAASEREDMVEEIFVDLDIKGFPLREYTKLMSELNAIISSFGKIEDRSKKDELHLAKHMMHLLRLYITGTDLLTKGEIITYREKEHDLLMDIRNSKYIEEVDDETIKKIELETKQIEKDVKLKQIKDPLEAALTEKVAEAEINDLKKGMFRITDDFWDLLKKYQDEFEYAKTHSEIPDTCDLDRIMDFRIEINKIAIGL